MRKKITNILISIILAFGLLVPTFFSFSVDNFAYAASEATNKQLDENGKQKDIEEQAEEADVLAGDEYVNVNVDKIFSAEGKPGEEGGLWNGLTTLLRFLVNGILLPFGIIYTTWRALYLAIFCYIAHWDPLNILQSARYEKSKSRNWEKSRGAIDFSSLGTFKQAPSQDMYQKASTTGDLSPLWRRNKGQNTVAWQTAMNTRAQHALLVEVRFMFTGLLIVFAVWSFLNIGIWIATLVLQIAGQAT